MDKRGRKRYRDRLTLVCPNCGVTFTKAPSLINGKVRYCSLKCYHEAKRNGASLPEQSGKKNPYWKGGVSVVEKRCGVCGKIFVSADANKRKYCSSACSNSAYDRSLRIRAATIRKRCGIIDVPPPSPTQKDRSNFLFRRWRKGVLTNDGFACVRCGATENLHAHHIEPFCVFPENGTNPDNGITLCATCHKVVHSSDFLADIQSNAVGCSIRGDFAGIY